ncbi:hypothetical protein KC878_01330 [Candidatus Saccharibacteria bacterium]|nr:hypothetical protein [Candidatus Saccharibacteria bacterium]MCB9821127.1 hypothetical protein [Candidatus Nomurabacteria bacterium]
MLSNPSKKIQAILPSLVILVSVFSGYVGFGMAKVSAEIKNPSVCRNSGGEWLTVDGGTCACPYGENTAGTACNSQPRNDADCKRIDSEASISLTDVGALCVCPSGFFFDSVDGCVTQAQIDCESSGGAMSGSECVCTGSREYNSSTGKCEIPSVDNSAYVAGPCEVAGSFLGIPTWYRGLSVDTANNCEIVLDTDKLSNTDISRTSVNPLIIVAFNVIDALSRVVGILAVAFVIVGGFKYVISDGAPDRANNARKTITNSLIGAVIAGVSSILITVAVKVLGA